VTTPAPPPAASRNLALAFPGQGAQHVGMGVEVADRWPSARKVFDVASAVLGIDLLAICRDGPEEALLRTDVQQPAILAVGAATTEALREAGATDDSRLRVVFGLSLGEFTALWAAGALTLPDALRLVRERGLGMQEASERVPSGLTALRCEPADAEAVCAEARAKTGGVCSIANLNAPGQVVISGDVKSLEEAEKAAAARGIRRPARLPVAGAFHSTLMESGARRLAAALETIDLRSPRVPVISNVTAQPTQDAAQIRRNLIAQVTSPVRFADCVRAAKALGVAEVVEPGPGRVLSGLVRRIDPDLVASSADSAEDVLALVRPAENRAAEKRGTS
jgi:[acyl-carrier-protein] S-malonyltransferase